MPAGVTRLFDAKEGEQPVLAADGGERLFDQRLWAGGLRAQRRDGDEQQDQDERCANGDG
jgi:hypothetical protein